MSLPVPIGSYQDYVDVARTAHQRTMEAYPRFQYSVFVGGNRDEQVVVRADSLEEFTRLKATIAPLLKQQSAPKPNNSNGVAKTSKCMRCGGEAEQREGVSRKTGKPYKGVVCVSQGCNYARFL